MGYLLLDLTVVLVWLVAAVLLIVLAYHYLFVIASWRSAQAPAAKPACRHRFAIVIPAHNEEAVIAGTVACARKIDYPAEQFDVHVAADYCVDRTAAAAASAGAYVHVRSDGPAGRKGFALAWCFEQLLAATPVYDAFVVLDADSRAEPDLLAVFDVELPGSQGVLQGQRLVANAGDSWLAAVAALDQRLNNRLRNQARTNLGWSARVMGDDMCFSRGVLLSHPWSAESLIEDREYGAQLLLDGIRTRYVSQARVWQEAAVGVRSGQQQRLRWYRGAVEIRRLGWQLIKRGVSNRSMAQLDGGIEVLMPAYSTLALFNLTALLVSCILPAPYFSPVCTGLLLAMLLAWGAYPVLGLVVDQAPAGTYRAFVYGPVYLVWRIWLGLLTRILGGRIQWVRTQRRDEVAGGQGKR